MKYLILIYQNEASRQLWMSLPEDQRQLDLDAYEVLDAELKGSGELIVSESLTDPEQATQVLTRAGQTSTTDGPFAEAKEMLAGFYLVNCVDLERAVEISARIPEAESGVIEIRPVRDLSTFPG